MKKNEKNREIPQLAGGEGLGELLMDTYHAYSRGESTASVRTNLLWRGLTSQDAYRMALSTRRAFLKRQAIDREVQATATLAQIDALFNAALERNDRRSALEILRLKCNLLELGSSPRS